MEHHDGFYRLAHKEAKYWDKLNTWFSYMVRPFTSREWGQLARQVLIPLQLKTSCYLEMCHTPGGVYAVCTSAQSIFVLWLAYFAFHLSMGNTASYSNPCAQWWHTECWDLGVPETILDAIMSQVAWDGSIPHVGIIHRVFDLPDKPTILWYIEHSIPVWYPWGPTEEHMCSIEPQGNKY